MRLRRLIILQELNTHSPTIIFRWVTRRGIVCDSRGSGADVRISRFRMTSRNYATLPILQELANNYITRRVLDCSATDVRLSQIHTYCCSDHLAMRNLIVHSYYCEGMVTLSGKSGHNYSLRYKSSRLYAPTTPSNFEHRSSSPT
jgi:hypothetical protein